MTPIEKAKLSLNGLSVGDAFGEKFFDHPIIIQNLIKERIIPTPPWHYTDDTAMGIVDVLEKYGQIDQNELSNFHWDVFKIF